MTCTADLTGGKGPVRSPLEHVAPEVFDTARIYAAEDEGQDHGAEAALATAYGAGLFGVLQAGS